MSEFASDYRQVLAVLLLITAGLTAALTLLMIIALATTGHQFSENRTIGHVALILICAALTAALIFTSWWMVMDFNIKTVIDCAPNVGGGAKP